MPLLARFCLLLSVLVTGATSAAELSLYALFKGKAIVQVDGTRRVLAVGESSPEGIKLISTDTEAEEAVVQVGNKRESLKLGVVMAAFDSGPAESVTLYADGRGFFHADGSINGYPVQLLVDTGANTVAMTTAVAKSAGIDYESARRGYSVTASGYAPIYRVSVNTIKVGGIIMHNVAAAVFDGPEPNPPLLGMSFLSAMEMKREGNQMTLTRRY